MGGVIIFEFFTSVIQDLYFIRMKGQRFFEKLRSIGPKKWTRDGWAKVVVRYWIIAAVLAVLALITLNSITTSTLLVECSTGGSTVGLYDTTQHGPQFLFRCVLFVHGK